jgi:hypothetical protein
MKTFNSIIMKNNFVLFALCLAAFSVGVIHGCTKDVGDAGNVVTHTGTPQDSIITTSFIEEFKDVYALTTTTGWMTKDNSVANSGNTPWGPGQFGTDKTDNVYGFPAYSYTSSQLEYAFSGGNWSSPISSWLFTPVLSVKNGDKISFYTRGDGDTTTDRMQVLMNKSTSADVGDSVNSVGGFTTVLFDLNSTETIGGYPATWTKYEYTFSGISGKMNTRIAFRHYVLNPIINVKGIGIDVFEFDVK